MTDRGARRFGHQHVEAFCLMTYRNEAGDEEVLWNSRDGVTPFVITLRDGSEAEHADWSRDEYAPLHVPKVGSRIFVSATRAIVRRWEAEKVERYWEDDLPGGRPCDRYESKGQAIDELMKGFRPGQPTIVEVTEEIVAIFNQRRDMRVTDGQHAKAVYAAAVRRGMPPSGRFA